MNIKKNRSFNDKKLQVLQITCPHVFQWAWVLKADQVEYIYSKTSFDEHLLDEPIKSNVWNIPMLNSEYLTEHLIHTNN